MVPRGRITLIPWSVLFRPLISVSVKSGDETHTESHVIKTEERRNSYESHVHMNMGTVPRFHGPPKSGDVGRQRRTHVHIQRGGEEPIRFLPSYRTLDRVRAP